MNYGTMHPGKWTMPIMDDADSKQVSYNLQASNLCFFPISFRFTLLCKNASANHLESHSCENKGLKTPWNHTLTKKGRAEGCSASSASVASSCVTSQPEAMLDRIAPAVYNASFIYECLRFHRTSTRPSGHPLGCNVYGAEDERTVRDG